MSRKHFERLADIVRRNLSVDAATRKHVAEELAEFCAEQNPRFDRERFLAACGVTA